MDAHIATFEAMLDSDLRICPEQGVAYQDDMGAGRAPYDSKYLEKCEAYEDTPIALAVNRGRCLMVRRYCPIGTHLLDIGAGTGAFVKAAMNAGFNAFGFDVIPEARERLEAANVFSDSIEYFPAVTFWDSLEHMEEPGVAVGRVQEGGKVFISVPVFQNLFDIRLSKHYRPGEHLYYWTPNGIERWMKLYGFQLLERSYHEVIAGRESIGAFAFRRDIILG